MHTARTCLAIARTLFSAWVGLLIASSAAGQNYVVSTLAGSAGTTGNVDGAGHAARFNNPVGITVDASRNVFVAELSNYGIRKITPAGVVSAFASNSQGALGLADGGAGTVFSANYGSHVIGSFAANGQWTQLAGQATVAGATNGTGSAATFNGPHAVARDAAGNLYVSDYLGHAIRKVAPGAVVTTLAGLSGTPGSADGAGSAGRFNSPTGIGVDASGNVYVAEYANHTIRRITAAGVVTTFAGMAGQIGSANGTGLAARFFHPIALAVDAAGNVYVGELANYTIRKITPGGVVTTIAGLAGVNGSADGTGPNARFAYPYAMAVDADGVIYVADSAAHTIRKLSPTSATTSTLAMSSLSRLATLGSTVSWTATPGDGQVYTYQWKHNGVPVAGATAATLSISNVTLANRGSYEVIAASGATTRRAVVMLVVAPVAGTVATWGANESGQADVPADLGRTAGVAAGDHHTLALKADGTVRGWGAGGNGELNVPPGLTDVVAIDVGNTHSVALRADGTVSVWGGAPDALPTVPAAAFNVVAISTGAHHVLALRSDGTVVAWGNNSNGQCNVPADLSGVIGVSAGTWHSVAVKSGGTVVAWGRNEFGETNVPAGLNAVSAASGGETHHLVLKTNGTLEAWGMNTTGETTIPAGLASVVAISTGGYHNLALKQDGTIAAWGSNAYGGTTIPAGLTQAFGISAGGFHSAAVVPLLGPEISTHPLPQVAGLGETATFNVTATGTGTLTYQWQRNGVNLTNGGRIQGATAATLVITSVATGDAGNYRVIVMDQTGSTTSLARSLAVSATAYEFSTVAGVGGSHGATDGGSNARFNHPYGVAVDGSGNVFVADNSNYTIRKIDPEGTVTTFAGVAGASGSVDGTGSAARFMGVLAVAVDSGGFVYVADSHVIRKITPAGAVTTLAGLAFNPGSMDGTGSAARFNQPQGIAVNSAGIVYVVDTGNHTLRKITPAGVATTLAGMAGASGSGNGAGSAARFSYPIGVAVDAAGTIYVAESANQDIRMVTPDGVVTTIAGLPGSLGSVDGIGSAARFMGPFGVAADAAGNVFVADTNAETIRKIFPGNIVRTIGGAAGQRGTTDGPGAAARFFNPASIAVGSSGAIFIADAGNSTIRKGVPVVLNTGPVIIAQPAHATAAVGGSATFTVNAVPATFYSWQRQPGGVGNYVSLSSSATYSGVSTATLQISGASLAMNGDRFRCSVWNDLVAVNSDAATLTVVQPPVFTSSSNATFTVGAANTFRPAVTASPPASFTVQAGSFPAWATLNGGTGEIAGTPPDTTGSPFTFTLQAANAGGTASQSFTLTVLPPPPPPTITVQSATRQVVAPGGSFTLGVNISSTTPPAYQWKRNGRGIPGANSANYAVTGATPRDNGWYQVMITNAGGSTTSPAMFVNVAINPGRVVAWGGNTDGECTVPSGLTDVIALAASHHYSLALKGDGTVVGWGRNLSGQATPPAGLNNVVAISAGYEHAVALRANGTVVAWGKNDLGQRNVPAGLDGVVAIDAAGAHTVALKSDGTVVSWGFAYSGETTVPGGLANVVGVAAGYNYSLAHTVDGTVVGWGANDFGQITIPSGLGNVIAIDAGHYHSVALKADGSVAAWGYNVNGETAVPAGLTGVVGIAASAQHNLALKADGTVVGWGHNAALQSTVPGYVAHAAQLAAGAIHSLVLCDATGIVAPVIAQQPQTQGVGAGQAVVLSVGVNGMGPLTYQWRKNGSAIVGATNSFLVLANIVGTDAGDYSVVITNLAGSVVSHTATLTIVPAMATHAVVGDGYFSGTTVTITNTLFYDGVATALGWQVLLPAGWSYASGSGAQGDARPAVGTTDLIEWAWLSIPASPVTFTYTLNVPASATGNQALAALAIVRLEGASAALQLLGRPDPLVVTQLTNHGADTDRNFRISLLELTRVIELYNTRNGTTRTGCYKVQAGTEDGFLGEPARTSSATVTLARYHSADSNRDGKVNLFELTRVIELYNYRSGTTRTGQYHIQGGTEDGFASGP